MDDDTAGHRIVSERAVTSTRPAGEAAGLSRDPDVLQVELERLRAENARLLRLLRLSPSQAGPPGPAQSGVFDAFLAR